MHRGQALWSLLDAFGVVPLDVIFDSMGEFLDVAKIFSVVPLGSKCPKKLSITALSSQLALRDID